MARPSKYTPRTVKKIVDALTAGNTRRAAAAYGGIDENTLGRWIARFGDFAEAVKSAEAAAEVGHVANITRASANGTWQASAWWLERRRHADWGRTDRLDVGGPDGGPLRIVITTVDDRPRIETLDDRRALP